MPHQLSMELKYQQKIDGEPMNFSMSFACPDCGVSIEEVEPRSFSFNNPFGACPEILPERPGIRWKSISACMASV